MEKKLLSVLLLVFIFFLSSWSGFGQCPTSVNVSADPGTTVCAGTNVTFTANISGGTDPQYQWQIDQSNVSGETSSNFTTNSLTNGQKVRVVITSGTQDDDCSKPSSEITMTVNPVRTPTVSVTANKTSLCSGESITFSASNTHGGNSPQYEWFVNNSTTISQTGQSVTFSSAEFNEGQNTVRVRLTSSHDCVTSDTAETTSSPFTLKPDASIAATTSTEIESCINTTISPIKFDIGGGGTGATVSGLPPGVTGSFSNGVYTISGSPTSAGSFGFTVNTTGTCAQTSASGTIEVNPDATLSLTSNNNNQTVCAAGGVEGAEIAPITYSIGETGTGASVTGLPTGISGSYINGTFTISGSSSETGTHNFSVTATGTCGPSSALTGSIIITGNLKPTVTITSSESENEICEGTEVTFTATSTNGGSSPAYQWQINGDNVGTNSNTFTTSSLTDGQIVTVVMTSNETCRTENTATSNGISTKVNPNLEPSVTIEPTDTDFCAGDEVSYKAIPVNGGPSPVYQWKVGSTVVGSGETFTSSTLTNGQSITVTLTSSETCVTTSTAVSEPVVTSVNENLVPSVTIESNDENNTICSGGSITFTATTVNGGDSPSHQWKVDGTNAGTNSPTFTSNTITNGQVVSVVLTSNEECLAENDVVSNAIEVKVDQDIRGMDLGWDNSNSAFNPTAICPVVSNLVYKVQHLEGATSYFWTFPSGWNITSDPTSNEVSVTATASAQGGTVKVKALSECGSSNELISPQITTGTVVYVEAGPDQTVCPGTAEINLAGEIGGVISQKKDWNWSDNGAGGSFKNNQGSDIKGIYTIPTSLRNGGTISITITSIDPPGTCGAKSDSMILTIDSAASITDATYKTQTVCVDSAIQDISFNVAGAGKGAEATGLPAGITGSFAEGIFTLTGTPTEAGTFNYTVTTTGECTNATRTGTLTVNPRPTFTQPEEVFVCAGSETSLISFSGSSVSGTTFEWTNDNTSIGLAASGTGNINSFTANNSTNEPLVANISVTPIANNCDGTSQEFQITVYPTTTLTKPEDLTVCNGENIGEIAFDGSNVSGTTYKWSNSNPSIGLDAEGTGNISSFTATNTTNAPIDATITVTPVANGCDGTPEEFKITVNPTPAFTAPENIVVCNGEDFSQLDFTGATASGTTYNWTNSNTEIGLASSATETGFLPSFTAVNNGNEPINATITVIPSANECAGEPVIFGITVNPTNEVNNIEDIVICNGEDFSEIVLSSNVAGTSYSWSNSNSGIGLPETGTGNIPAFSAENNTEAAITATITVTPTANECEGNPFSFDVIVNPNATVDAGPDQTICSSGVATMAAVLGGGASEGTWTTSGSGTFTNNNINSDYTPSDSDILNGSVILTYTSNDPEGPCGTASDTMELFLNEEALITTQPENLGLCSTEPSELTVIASGDNLTYEWRRTDGVNISNSNGIYSSTLSFNNTTSTHAGEYYVIVRGEDTCGEVESERVTINVDENIIINEPTDEIPICGDGFSQADMKVIAHAGDSPLTFVWYKDGVPVDDSDSKITITGPTLANGKYEGTLNINGVTVDYNGDYYVEITGPEEFTCSTAVTNPFQVRLKEMPALPEVEDLVVCQNETPETFTVTTGTDLKWYLNEDDTEFIVNEAGQSAAPVPSTDVPGDFYFWVTQQPEACESEKVQVKVTVQPKPETPTLTAEEATVEYCLGEIATPLTATGTDGSSLNWYDSETGEALTSAPEPTTENPGVTTYWVSQTPVDGLGCESDRAEITVTVFALPEVTASVEESIICKGSPAELSASGGVSYIWYDGEDIIGTEASISHTPADAGDYTFTVVVTDTNNCENTASLDVQVDENTVAGTISGQESVCISSPSGSFILEGNTGDIQRWESSTDNGSTWTDIANTSSTFQFTDLTTPTIFRAVVKNGVCDEMHSNEIEVTIDLLPVGGELSFDGNGRVFVICENPVGNYAVDLNLTGIEGEVVRWGYRNWDATGYTTLNIGGEVFTGNTITAAQIQALGFNETTVFQVEVTNGACEAPAYSKTAILSVIPSDIAPSPVTVDPGVVCLGEEVTLSSETGYESGATILDQGAFDNASITNHGWRIRREGISGDLGFDTDANNTEFDRWKRATPRAFTTASINSPYNTSGVVFDTGIEDGNKGFGLISGDYRSTMETPIFTIGSMDQAVLTFDQAYVLTPGSSIKVEISTDGGNTYSTIYIREVPATATQGIASGNTTSFGTGTIDSHPENKILIDLGDYIGRPNLRIRFNYSGSRPGDIWAVDNIDIPEGPAGITMEWRDYTDPEIPEGVFIGTNNSEKWAPNKIGLNVFEVKTKLVFNSNGDACETAENAQRIDVFVFDKYTSNVTADYGSCGNFTAQLNAVVTNGTNDTIQSYPTPDGYIGKWEISDGTLVDSDPDDGIAAINDPKAILSTDATGTYSVSWILERTAEDENGVLYENPESCPPVVNPLDVAIEGCIALDFDGVNDYVDLGTNYTGSNYSIEAWVRPLDREIEGGFTDASTGTIISGPGFEIKMENLPADISPNGRWYHIAYTSDGTLYIDGILQSANSISGVGGSQTLIGARWNSSEKRAENFFSGWIEEVRIWNGNISQENIRFTMNQRLKAEGNIGIEVDMDHPDAPDVGNLAGYYRLISANPDPANLVNFAAELLPANGITPNLANANIPGRLINMETNQQNTAPLPYFSINDGLWATDETWARPEVWDPPHTGDIEWNIVRTRNNIQSGARDIKVLGLISEVNKLQMDGSYATSGWNTAGTGNPLYVTHYLKLDGVIDLVGESQLIQPNLSIVDAASAGYLERDQQGTANSFNYNYWSSPVSTGTGNVPYTVAGVLQDGSDPANPATITFGDPHAFADGGKTNPIKISNYWISIFNGVADLYGDWEFQYGSEGIINVGEGYTMKGTSGPVPIPTAQNYVFAGKPNNGEIILSVDPNTNYLLGNPYASAISIREFILDNLSPQDVTGGRNTTNTFNGALYFWEHFGQKDSHILLDYVGGYATGNLVGGVPAASVDYRIDQTGKFGKKVPGDFVPVGQGFFVNTVIDSLGIAGSGGNLLFQNSQRFFIPDANGDEGEAVFLRPENHAKEAKAQERPKIRLGYISPLNFKRQILVGVDPNTTNGFDLGYDAPLNDYNSEDMYWIQDNNWLVIQGVPHFDKEQVLPLGIILKEKGEFTIQIDKLENIDDDKNIYLNDKLKDSIHDLRASPYKIKADGGYHNERFEIVFFKEIATDPPIVDGPGGGKPGGGEIPEDITNLTVRYSHTRQEIQILNPDQVALSNMYIFNLNGNQLINHRNLSHEKDVRVPVRNYSSGVYIVKLYSEGNVISKKIIINN